MYVFIIAYTACMLVYSVLNMFFYRNKKGKKTIIKILIPFFITGILGGITISMSPYEDRYLYTIGSSGHTMAYSYQRQEYEQYTFCLVDAYDIKNEHYYIVSKLKSKGNVGKLESTEKREEWLELLKNEKYEVKILPYKLCEVIELDNTSGKYKFYGYVTSSRKAYNVEETYKIYVPKLVVYKQLYVPYEQFYQVY